MVVVERGDHIAADTRVGERLREGCRQADSVQSGMHAEADACPFALGADADRSHAFVLANQGEDAIFQVQPLSTLKGVALS